jgi:ABC-type nitrate/sulfonate/bicarbonate transport system substrate-binding protein
MMLKLTLVAALVAFSGVAHAEVDVVKIPKGAGGVGFLPLIVMEEKKLVEAEAQKTGLALKAEYIKLGGPARLHHDLGSHARQHEGHGRRCDDVDPDVPQHQGGASEVAEGPDAE